MTTCGSNLLLSCLEFDDRPPPLSNSNFRVLMKWSGFRCKCQLAMEANCVNMTLRGDTRIWSAHSIMLIVWIVDVTSRPRYATEAERRHQWNALLESPQWMCSDVRSRILRYHKGCSSPQQFDAANHEDTRCFLFGRLMLRYLAAMLRGEGPTHLPIPIGEVGNGDKDGVPNFITQPFQHHRHHASPSEDSNTDEGTTYAFSASSPIGVTEHGKPFIKGPFATRYRHQAWNANVTHAGRLVALGATSDGICGIDVMPVETVPYVALLGADRTVATAAVLQFLDAFGDYFTIEEWDYIGYTPPAPVDGPSGSTTTTTAAIAATPLQCLTRFYHVWTLKESYLKAVGIGLYLDLKRVSFRLTTSTPHEVLPTLSTAEVKKCVGGTTELLPIGIEARLDGNVLPSTGPLSWRFGLFSYSAAAGGGSLQDSQKSVGAFAIGPFSSCASDRMKQNLESLGAADASKGLTASRCEVVQFVPISPERIEECLLSGCATSGLAGP